MLDLAHPGLNFASHLGVACSLAVLLYTSREAFIYLFKKSLVDPFRKEKLKRSRMGFALFVGGFLFIFLMMLGLNAFVSGVLGGAVSFFLPHYVISRQQEKFEHDFDASLVESLTTVNSSLKAGLTLHDALGVAVKNCSKIFANEVELALKQNMLGVPLEKSLDDLRNRVGTVNASMAFGAMIVGNQLGGNLSATLETIVNTVRERERVAGKLRSLTAQGRMQSVLLCSAPPALAAFMFLWDRDKMALLTDTFSGQVLLSMAIVLEVIGIIATKRVMKLEI